MPNPSILRFEHVTVTFDDVPALVDLSFEAFEGESRVILGASGSGKTVLLKTALGLVKPASGKIFAFGQDLTAMSERALFDSLTIEENVAYPLLNQRSIHCPPDQVRPRVEEALEFVELGGTLEKFPSELSGGMRRRAAIARAVVTGPPLVLYDSPTAGLDPITAHTIISLVVKERDVSRVTSLMVTHRYQDGNLLANFHYNPERKNIEPAHNGTRADLRTVFMVLREGRLVFEGNQDQLEAEADPYIVKFVKRRE